MKILIDGQAAQGLSSKRGLGVYTKNLIESLAISKDADVEIYVLLNAKLTRPTDCLEAQLMTNSGISGVIFWPGGIDPNPFSRKSQNETDYLNSLIQNWFIASLEVDCVIYPGFMENGLEETSLGRFGPWFNSIVIHHDFIQVGEGRKGVSKATRQRFRNLLDRSSSASGYIFISDFTRVKASDYLPQHVPFIVAYPPMTHVPASQPNKESLPSQDVSRLLFLGGTDSRKNLYFVLRSLRTLKFSQPHNLSLDILGPNSLAKFLLLFTYIKLSNLRSFNIRFHGYVSEKKLTNFYEHSDLLIVPSTSEGFGLPVFEALSHGATILVARNSALAEVASSEALTFELKIDDLAGKLSLFFSDQNYRQLLSAISQKRFFELADQISKSGNDILRFASDSIRNTQEVRVADRNSLDHFLMQALRSAETNKRILTKKEKILELINACSLVLDLHENRARGIS